MSDDWPIKGQSPELAWGLLPNLQATAVPLRQQDLRTGSLDLSGFREALAERLSWLVEREPDPAAALRLLVDRLDQAGVSHPPVKEGAEPAQVVLDLLHSPSFLTLLGRLPPFPMPVRRLPAAVLAVKETSLGMWLAAVTVQPGATE